MRWAAAAAALVLATPAYADMYQDASNAKLPEAMNKLAAGGITTPLWLHAGTGTITYAGGSTIQASNAYGQPAFYGETRTSGWLGTFTGGGTIGNYTVAYADHPAQAIPVWAGYDECNIKTGAFAPVCIAREISMYTEIAPATLTPNATNLTNMAVGLRVDSGKGGVLGTSQNTSALLHLTENGGQTLKGILFSKGAMVPGVGAGGNGVAIEMATGQAVRWMDPGGNVTEMWGGTFAGALGVMFATHVNVGGDLYVASHPAVKSFAGGLNLFEPAGAQVLTLATGYNYHANGSHIFASAATGGTTYVTIDSHGIVVPVMPTSCTGAASKTLWNNTGVVNICP